MAAKQDQQLTGDGLTSHIAGMSKSQLYDIMCQMKGLIEQNQQQARQILIDNPLLTRALFQAQIMLGMVQPSQAVPKIQQALSQPQVGTQSNAQITQPSQSQASLAQLPIPARQQPSISLPSASNFQSQPNPPQTTSAFVNSQGSIAPPQQSSQLHNVMPPSMHYSHIPMVSGQAQHSLQAPGLLHQPLPQHVRPPPSMQPFAHQQLPQMPPGLGFQPSQPLFPQSLFHSGVNLTSFTQGQPPLHSQHHLYQGFPQVSFEYGNQGGTSSMQPDRGGGQFAPFFSGQMSQATGGNPPPLPPDVEKALLQQVMSLTPEQISLLPPEQRHQVIQLQEMLR